jgi:hypothetical protein
MKRPLTELRPRVPPPLDLFAIDVFPRINGSKTDGCAIRRLGSRLCLPPDSSIAVDKSAERTIPGWIALGAAAGHLF